MQFKVKEWRKIYDKVQKIGKRIKDSYPYRDSSGVMHDGIPLEFNERFEIEQEIKRLTNKSDNYLNACEMKLPEPLWLYDNKDITTWISEPTFRFGYLLRMKGQINA